MSDVNQDTHVRRLVAAAIEKRRAGVDYGYDVTWMPAQIQTPQGPRMMPVYTLLLTRGSPLIGQPPLSHIAQIPSSRPTAEQVGEQVGEGIRLLAERHEQLKRPPAAPPAGNVPPMALANGHRR